MASLILGFFLGHGYHLMQLRKTGLTYYRISELAALAPELSSVVSAETDILALQSMAYLKFLLANDYESATSFALEHLRDYRKKLSSIPIDERTELQGSNAKRLEAFPIDE